MPNTVPDPDMRGARFTNVDLSGAEFRSVDLTGARIIDALLVDVELSGLIVGMKVNDVEVAPLVEAELDRRHPERLLLRATTAAGLLEGLHAIDELWRPTLEFAQTLPPDLLNERVRGEWSLVETLRHLIFATDAWFARAVLGDEHPYHDIGLVPAFLDGRRAELGLDADAAPSLETVLDVRSAQMVRLRQYLNAVQSDELAGTRLGLDEHGYPPSSDHTVLQCLHVVLDEEWNHHQYAARDLATLSTSSP